MGPKSNVKFPQTAQPKELRKPDVARVMYPAQSSSLQSKLHQPAVYRPQPVSQRPNAAPPVYRPQPSLSQMAPARSSVSIPGHVRQAGVTPPPDYPKPFVPQRELKPALVKSAQPAAFPAQVNTANAARLAQFETRRQPVQASLPLRSSYRVPPTSRSAIQPLILTIKGGQLNDGVLDLEVDVLKQGYNDNRDQTLTNANIASFQSSKSLGAANSSEILVLNAHGSNNTVSGRSASQMAQFLISVGAVGYKQIHIYACQAGMSLYDFDQELSKLLKTPVWAPRGNITFNSSQGRYQVRMMTYNAESNKWVPKGNEEYGPDQGWWYSVNGRTVDMGIPPKPGTFPVEAPVDLSQYQFEVVGSSEDK